MNVKVVTDLPAWFIIFCLLAGGGYAFFLYYREKRFSDTPVWIKRLMAFIRFVSVTLLCFLLLNPLLKTVSRDVEKPVIVIAQDNSESIVIGKDSSFYRKEYLDKLAKLGDGLSGKYEVLFYHFGDKLKTFSESDLSQPGKALDFKDKETDVSGLFEELEARYSNRNLGAVIIASDGLYNKGLNPVYSSAHIKAPVFTIALGDTNVRKDLLINKVINNRLAYFGNKFPVEVVLEARQCKGSAATLTVSKGEQTLFTQKVEIKQDAFTATIPLELEAKEIGLQRYRARITPIDGEISLANNVQDFFIEVMDGREKVLILADAPHPDIAALKQSIENNQNYEVEVAMAKDFDKKLNGYNLVILHNLPSQTGNARIISEAASSGIPLLFIIGMQTNIRNFNNLQTGLLINGFGQRFNEPQPVLEDHFPLFTLGEPFRNYVHKLPVLQTPFGSYKASNSCTPLFYQEIGIVKTKDPMMVFSQMGDKKIGIIAGEGIWRWRLQDYQDHNNHDLFNELIDKTVQFLSVKQDKSQFRIVCKNNYQENRPVEMEAEVYNESYELINTPEVNIELINAQGQKFPFTFSKTTNAYRLNAGLFPPGEYKYRAKTKIGEKVMSQNGEFSVTPLLIEASNTTANHQLLYRLAHLHQGEMMYPAELDKLKDKILAREDIRPVIYNTKKLVDLVELKWLFFLFLFLLSAEWFMRKRNGAY